MRVLKTGCRCQRTKTSDEFGELEGSWDLIDKKGLKGTTATAHQKEIWNGAHWSQQDRRKERN